jgi:hypothetical protein
MLHRGDAGGGRAGGGHLAYEAVSGRMEGQCDVFSTASASCNARVCLRFTFLG